MNIVILVILGFIVFACWHLSLRIDEIDKRTGGKL